MTLGYYQKNLIYNGDFECSPNLWLRRFLQYFTGTQLAGWTVQRGPTRQRYQVQQSYELVFPDDMTAHIPPQQHLSLLRVQPQLLLHQMEMLQFLFYTEQDIIYETFELKHAAYLEKKKGEGIRKMKSEEIERHADMVSERVHIRVLRDDIDLDKLLSRLELLWHNRRIPYLYRYYFLMYIFTTYFKNLQQPILNEQRLIREQQHIYYSIFRAIHARETCLRQLKRSLAQLFSDDVYEYLHIAKQRLYNQRKKQQQEKLFDKQCLCKF